MPAVPLVAAFVPVVERWSALGAKGTTLWFTGLHSYSGL